MNIIEVMDIMTPLELKLLVTVRDQGFCDGDLVRGYVTEHYTHTDGMQFNMKQLRGVMSSLVKKNIIRVSEDNFIHVIDSKINEFLIRGE